MRYKEFKLTEQPLVVRKPIARPDDMDNGDSTIGLEAGPPYPQQEMDAVKALQSRLEELGYSVGSTGVDGKFGPRTTRAVRAFKRDNGIATPANVLSLEEITMIADAEKVDKPSPTGNEANKSAGGSETTVELPEPEGGGSGQLRLNTGMGPLLDLDGNESRLTKDDADREMKRTIQMARKMASIFGKPITINDAIAKAGTSREDDTPGSQHFHGTALDLSTSGYSDEEKLQLVRAAMEAGFTGFGFGNSILHVDRGPRRFWDYGNPTFGGIRVAQLGAAVQSGDAIA